MTLCPFYHEFSADRRPSKQLDTLHTGFSYLGHLSLLPSLSLSLSLSPSPSLLPHPQEKGWRDQERETEAEIDRYRDSVRDREAQRERQRPPFNAPQYRPKCNDISTPSSCNFIYNSKKKKKSCGIHISQGLIMTCPLPPLSFPHPQSFRLPTTT